MLIYKIRVVSSALWCLTSPATGFQLGSLGMNFLLGEGLKFNQKSVVYPYNIYNTIVPMGFILSDQSLLFNSQFKAG